MERRKQDKGARPVASQRVSLLLKNRRHELGVSLDAVSQATKISISTLTDIEEGNFSNIASPTYAKGFIKNYARFLGIDQNKAINLYMKEAHPKSREIQEKEGNIENKILKKITRDEKSVYYLLGGIAVFILIALILAQLNALFTKPLLRISAPIEAESGYSGNITIVEDTFIVSGITGPQTVVRLNGEAILLNPDLSFSSSRLPLGDKGTNIRITSTNQFGRESEINLHITKGAAAYSATDDKLIMIMEITDLATAVEVITDGTSSFNERAFPGDIIVLEAKDTITLKTQDPALLKITINGKKIEDLKTDNTWQMADFR